MKQDMIVIYGEALKHRCRAIRALGHTNSTRCQAAAGAGCITASVHLVVQPCN